MFSQKLLVFKSLLYTPQSTPTCVFHYQNSLKCLCQKTKQKNREGKKHYQKKKEFLDTRRLTTRDKRGFSVRFVLLHATLTRFSNERNSFLQPLHDHDEFFTIDPIEWIMKISLHTLFLSYVGICMYLLRIIMLSIMFVWMHHCTLL